jgi:hypothetical protein
MPPLVIVILSVIWVMLARFVLLAGFAAAGLAPTIAG